MKKQAKTNKPNTVIETPVAVQEQEPEVVTPDITGLKAVAYELILDIDFKTNLLKQIQDQIKFLEAQN